MHVLNDYLARGALWKPAFRWDPSQKGLSSEWPQRHSENICRVSNRLPSASSKATGPLTRNEPSSRTVIVTMFSESTMYKFTSVYEWVCKGAPAPAGVDAMWIVCRLLYTDLPTPCGVQRENTYTRRRVP